MLSSGQVAALIQQQNQMFSSNAQYAQQISAGMPGAYQGGLGQFGTGSPVQSFPNVPFAPHHQGGFNYGGATPLGYGLSNQVAGMGMSAMGAGGNALMGGLGIAGGLGMLGSAGRMLDPFSMGAGGFTAARGMGMGMAGSLGVGAMGAALPMAGFAMAKHAVGSMVEGGQEQAGLERVMSQFQHINPSSRTGRGFTRQDAMGMGEMVRNLQSMPEMLTSFGEMSRVLDKVGQMGLMQGAKDIGDFQRKFKDVVGTLKNVSKVMGSTMEEAAAFMGESRRSGFYSQADITKNAIARQLTSGVTGMNQGQVGQLQQFGSQVSFATGGTRKTGARHALRTANQLGMMNQMGHLSNDDIAEMTGEEGAAGIQSLAGSMTEAAHRMSQSSVGTAMTLALGKQKGGRYTGEMDEELMEQWKQGGIGKAELMQMARSKAGSRKAKLSYAAQKNKLRSEMAGGMGVEGMGQMLGSILGERGWDNPDAQNLVMQRFGLDERQAGLVQNMMQKMPEIQRGMMGSASADKRRIAEQAHYRETYSLEAIKKKIGKRIENAMTEPFKEIGASLRNSIAETVEGFVDDLTGRYTVEVTKAAKDTILAAASGSKQAQARISAAQTATAAYQKKSPGRVQRDSLASLTGDRSSVNDLLDFTSNFAGGKYLEEKSWFKRGGRKDSLTDTGREQMAQHLDRLQQGKGGLSGKQAGALMGNEEDYTRFKELVGGSIDLQAIRGMDPVKAMHTMAAQVRRAAGAQVSNKNKDFIGSLEANGLDLQTAVMEVARREGFSTGGVSFGSAAAFTRGGKPKESSEALYKRTSDLKKKLQEELGHKDSGIIMNAVAEGGAAGGIITRLLTSAGKDKKARDALMKEAERLNLKPGEMAAVYAAENAARQGKGAGIKDYDEASLSSAASIDAEQKAAIGASLAGRLKDVDLGAVRSKEGSDVLSRMRELGEDLRGGKLSTGDAGDLAMRLGKIDPRSAEGKALRKAAGGELGAAASAGKQALKSLKGKGMEVDEFAKKFGINLDDKEMMDKLRGMSSGNRLDEKHGGAEAAKLVAGRAFAGAGAGAGKAGGAESEAVVAKNLADFSGNVVKLADLLGNMKSDDAKNGTSPGKTP